MCRHARKFLSVSRFSTSKCCNGKGLKAVFNLEINNWRFFAQNSLNMFNYSERIMKQILRWIRRRTSCNMWGIVPWLWIRLHVSYQSSVYNWLIFLIIFSEFSTRTETFHFPCSRDLCESKGIFDFWINICIIFPTINESSPLTKWKTFFRGK